MGGAGVDGEGTQKSSYKTKTPMHRYTHTRAHTHGRTYTCAHRHRHSFSRTHIHIHTRASERARAHTHTHTHAHSPSTAANKPCPYPSSRPKFIRQKDRGEKQNLPSSLLDKMKTVKKKTIPLPPRLSYTFISDVRSGPNTTPRSESGSDAMLVFTSRH